MGITVVCQSCGNRRTVPASLYDEKIRGRLVKIPCRGCGTLISVDGTLPPPPLAELPGTTPTTEDPLKVVIPAMARVPAEHQRFGTGLNAPLFGTESVTEQFFDSSPSNGEPLPPPREKQISHVDGPISERGPVSTLGRYALFEQFATGGMATVHFGRLDGAGGFSRVVAIKKLLPHLVQC